MDLSIRRIEPGDEGALADFYNGLTGTSKRTFRPLGEKTTTEKCREIVEHDRAKPEKKYDLAVFDGGHIVGWGFLWSLDGGAPSFGLGVADAYQGQGLGRALMERVLDYARRQRMPKVHLTVVQDNHKARKMYERRGFVKQEAFVGEDGLPYYSMILEPKDTVPLQT